MQGKLKSSKIQTCTTDHASYSLTQLKKFEQMTFKWLSGARTQDKNKQDYNCVHFFLFSLLLCESKKIRYQTREFRAKLHLRIDIGFQVQFNAEFPRQVMNCPIVFFDVAIKRNEENTLNAKNNRRNLTFLTISMSPIALF